MSKAAASREPPKRWGKGPGSPVPFAPPPPLPLLIASNVGYSHVLAWGGGDAAPTTSGPSGTATVLMYTPRGTAVSPEAAALARAHRVHAASRIGGTWSAAFARSLRALAVLFLVRPPPLLV